MNRRFLRRLFAFALPIVTVFGSGSPSHALVAGGTVTVQGYYYTNYYSYGPLNTYASLTFYSYACADSWAITSPLSHGAGSSCSLSLSGSNVLLTGFRVGLQLNGNYSSGGTWGTGMIVYGTPVSIHSGPATLTGISGGGNYVGPVTVDYNLVPLYGNCIVAELCSSGYVMGEFTMSVKYSFQ